MADHDEIRSLASSEAAAQMLITWIEALEDQVTKAVEHANDLESQIRDAVEDGTWS